MGKEKISVTLDAHQVREISDLVGEKYDNRSEAVRALIEMGLDYDDLENERDRLRRQLAAVNAREEDIDELVEYVDQQRELDRRRERRREAPAWRRAKWWLIGYPTDG